MRKSIKLIIRILIGALLGIILALAIFLGHLTVREYRPGTTEKLKLTGNSRSLPGDKKNFTFFTWNIGYGGIGRKMDFFYEGGARVRPEKEEFQQYFDGICETIRQFDSVDFIFIQEIDLYSKRSYYTNEESAILAKLPYFCSAFAKNYDCDYIPVPLSDPFGRVKSGLATISKFTPVSAERIAYTADFPWPQKLFFLKRCFMVMRFPLGSGKEIVVVNTHNSTYDKTGELRKSEFIKLHSFLSEEYRKGNYVICGGDLNNNPRGFDPRKVTSGDKAQPIETPVDSTFLPGWQFVFDPRTPTDRLLDNVYIKGQTITTIIDFFVISPNVTLQEAKTMPMDFAFSDHNPVFMKVLLN
jgi:endonuclease/exonuclease/phosphatase family metal-dependent hydrolase